MTRGDMKHEAIVSMSVKGQDGIYIASISMLAK